jgi:hypothetical protein
MDSVNNYIVRWLTNVYDEEYEIKQKYFTNENEAKTYFNNTLSNSYPKKLITPDSVTSSDETEASYVPGGSDIKPMVVYYHTDYSYDDVHTFMTKYFDNFQSAEQFYNSVSSCYAKRLKSAMKNLIYSEEWAKYLPN